MEKYKTIFKEGNFDQKEFEKVADKVVGKLWSAFNDTEKELKYYLKKSGQGGTWGAFNKQYIDPLKDAIENLDNATDSK